MWIYRGRSGRTVIQGWCRQRLDDWALAHQRKRDIDDSPWDYRGAHLVVAGARNRETLVVLPGRHGNAAVMTDLLERLADRYRVVAVDLPGEAGLGSAGRPNTQRLYDYGAWLDGLLLRLARQAPAGVTVLAHGSGAAVALAARPAPHITGLILLSPYGLIRPAAPVRVTAALWRWRIAPTATASARLLARLAGPNFTPPTALVEWLRLVGRHVAMSTTPPPHPELAHRWRGTPVTVAVGEHDPLFGDGRLVRPVRQSLHARLVTVADAGMLLLQERPEAILAILRHHADIHAAPRMDPSCHSHGGHREDVRRVDQGRRGPDRRAPDMVSDGPQPHPPPGPQGDLSRRAGITCVCRSRPKSRMTPDNEAPGAVEENGTDDPPDRGKDRPTGSADRNGEDAWLRRVAQEAGRGAAGFRSSRSASCCPCSSCRHDRPPTGQSRARRHLMHAAAGPPTRERGGAGPLLANLDAYFATGSVTTGTARRLHLSVRAVTNRLEQIAELTGYDPTDPAQRFTVHAAVLGARLLGRPGAPRTRARPSTVRAALPHARCRIPAGSGGGVDRPSPLLWSGYPGIVADVQEVSGRGIRCLQPCRHPYSPPHLALELPASTCRAELRRRATTTGTTAPSHLKGNQTMTHPNVTTHHDRSPAPAAGATLDFELVALIVRRAGLDCQVEEASSPPILLARRTNCDPAPWTVTAGTCLAGPTTSLVFVGPAGAARTRLVLDPDERHLAALVVLQAHRDDPEELFSHDEASAAGLAVDLVWD